MAATYRLMGGISSCGRRGPPLSCQRGGSVSRLSRWIKEPFCGVSHFVGALLAIAALVVLLVLADGRFWHVLGFSIYGTTLILLYTASTLCHSVHCAPRTAKRLDKLDHFAIFLLIAGTYTPICLVALRGPV